MKTLLLAAVAAGGLIATSLPSFALDDVRPGTAGTVPLARTGSGTDSAVTGYSQGGRGGAGGVGGVLSNGTADGAGTATGGNSGGNPQSGGGS